MGLSVLYLVLLVEQLKQSRLTETRTPQPCDSESKIRDNVPDSSGRIQQYAAT